MGPLRAGFHAVVLASEALRNLLPCRSLHADRQCTRAAQGLEYAAQPPRGVECKDPSRVHASYHLPPVLHNYLQVCLVLVRPLHRTVHAFYSRRNNRPSEAVRNSLGAPLSFTWLP